MTENKFKVLVFDPSNRNPIHTAHLIHALSERCSVTALMPYRREETEFDEGKSIGEHRPFRVPLRVNQGPRKLLAYLRNWVYLFRNASRFDVIHIEWLSLLNYTGIELTLMRRLLARNPHVLCTAHDVAPLHGENEQKTWQRYHRLYTMVPAILVHSDYARRVLEASFGIHPSKIHVIELAPLIEEKKNPAPEKARTSIGMIGAIKPYKGVVDAIRAYSLIAPQTGADFLLAGRIDPVYKAEICELLDALQLSHRVRMVDRYLTISEITDFHRELLVGLFPYHRITQSGAVLVSLNLGVPVVVYDTGGISEVVDPGRTGYVVRVGDIEGLAKAIRNILKDSPTDYYQRCRQSVAHRSWSKSVSQILHVYQSLLYGSQGVSDKSARHHPGTR